MKESIIDFDEAYNFYCEGNSMTKTEAIFKKRKKSLKRVWLERGYKYPLYQRQTVGIPNPVPPRKDMDLKVDYFKDIDNNDKAYWLGLIAADGGITQKFAKSTQKGSNYAKSYTFSISLKESDKYLLEYLKEVLNTNLELREAKEQWVKVPGMDKQYLSGKQFTLRIYRNEFVRHLIDNGIEFNKSINGFNIPKNLSKEFYNEFIRGYFDGDGCIGIYKGKYYSFHPRCYICSKTSIILEEFKLYFEENNIDCFIKEQSGMNYLEIRSKSVIDFWDLIKPKENSKCFLKRKAEKFEWWRSYKEQSLLENRVNCLEKPEGVNQQPS